LVIFCFGNIFVLAIIIRAENEAEIRAEWNEPSGFIAEEKEKENNPCNRPWRRIGL
jgi:hypothetical protein